MNIVTLTVFMKPELVDLIYFLNALEGTGACLGWCFAQGRLHPAQVTSLQGLHRETHKPS